MRHIVQADFQCSIAARFRFDIRTGHHKHKDQQCKNKDVYVEKKLHFIMSVKFLAISKCHAQVQDFAFCSINCIFRVFNNGF